MVGITPVLLLYKRVCTEFCNFAGHFAHAALAIVELI